MQSGSAEIELRGAIFSVRLADLVARELILTGTNFLFPDQGDRRPAELSIVDRARAFWLKVHGDPSLPDVFDLEIAENSHEIANLLSERLSEHSVDEHQSLALSANIAVAYLLMRAVQRALEEIERVLDADPSHSRALLLKARAEFYTGNLKPARDAAIQVRGDETTQALLLLAESCVACGDVEQAVALYSRLLQSEGQTWLFARARLLRLASLSGSIENAADFVVPLQSAADSSLLAALALAEHWFNSGEMTRAETLMKDLRASDATSENFKRWVCWQLGRMLFLSGNHLSSCDWYGEICREEIDTLAHREYVHALYRAGLIPAAQKRARSIRGKMGRVVHGITEIEADALAQSGNFTDARGLILELIADRPSAGHLLLSLAKLYAITGDMDKAKQCMAQIDPLSLPDELLEDVKSLNAELSRG